MRLGGHHAMRMRALGWLLLALAWAWRLGVYGSAWADPLPLENAPAGAAEAPPNLILSVGDSRRLGQAGLQALRPVLRSVFGAEALPDGSLRLAHQSGGSCRARPDGRCGQPLILRSFGPRERERLFQWADGLQPDHPNSAHLLFAEVGRFMRGTGVEGPYAALPGQAEAPVLACRRSYHLFVGAGGWEDEASAGEHAADAGSADGTRRVLPDGVVFDPEGQTEAVTRVYRDGYVPRPSASLAHPNGRHNTLADFAFDQWASDLQATLADQVPPQWRQRGLADMGTPAAPFKLPEYWNPKNDPATWQHLSTSTVGIHLRAEDGLPEIGVRRRPWWAGDTWSGDFQALLRGEVGWCNPMFTAGGSADGGSGHLPSLKGDGPLPPNLCVEPSLSDGRPLIDEALARARLQELWHVALNGRGRFVQATDQEGLRLAFSDLLGLMQAVRGEAEVALASGHQTLDAGAQVFLAAYRTPPWRGELQAFGVDPQGRLQPRPDWEAGQVLQGVDPTQRLIWTHDGQRGVRFEWAALSAGQRDLLKGGPSAPDVEGTLRLRYLRGDRTAEAQRGGRLRDRDTLLGDIVHSAPWWVGAPQPGRPEPGYPAFVQQHRSRPGMVYVGANDGMLHGFSVVDGRERLAYVPLGAWPQLRALTEPADPHRHSVDGGLMSGEVLDAGTWKTLLLGTLGVGGRGYFVLDVSAPAQFAGQDPARQVVLDRSDGADPDIGHLILEPTLDPAHAGRVLQFSRLNNGRWAVLLGNGVNSRNENAVLLIQYLDGAKELLKLPTAVPVPVPVPAGAGAGAGNGLSTPRLIDFNGDGLVDVAYAGDQLGQLWKFDLSSARPSDWGVAAPGRPIFVAEDPQGRRQPITAAPAWLPRPYGGVMLGLGTGRLLTLGDRSNTGVQTLYGLWDPARVGLGGSGVQIGPAVPLGPGWRQLKPAPLVAQQRTEVVRRALHTFYRSSRHPVNYLGPAAVRGWYMDLPTPRERALSNGVVLGRLWLQRSLVPARSEPVDPAAPTCELPLREAVSEEYLLDLFSGAPAPWPAFDTDGGGFTGTELADISGWRSGPQARLWQRSAGSEVLSLGRGVPLRLRVLGGPSARIGWRQLQ